MERKKFQAALDGCHTGLILNFSQEYLEGNGQEGREILSGRARFIFEYLRGSDMAKILKTAVTAGSASAATEGFAGMEDVID